MEQFRDVLFDVWREACRHIDIDQAAGNIAQLLGRQLPLQALLVRGLTTATHQLDTVTVGSPSRRPIATEARRQLNPAEWKQLLRWGRAGDTFHLPMGHEQGELGFFSVEGIVGDLLAGPLTNTDGLAGVLVVVGDRGQTFHADHKRLFQALLEPFSVAIENDRRLHELRALREAAEADRRSLLSRLGEQGINEAVVGSETGLRNVMERVELVAKSDVPVLILGETGTGKEVVSRAIHTRSKRSGGPFIRVNCGAIPAELIDSQLFGHEKGSFTGASEQHQGWFERANGGTLFLDEIGELPLPAQVRLLRVLQDGQVERVGGRQAVHVNVRMIAATHRDLATMVKARTFREDLWYRINVFPILLPQLRERIEDIPALVRHFAKRAAHRFGLPDIEVTPSDIGLLMKYHWPGNIRELGAVIDRAAILGNGRTLEISQAFGLTQATAAKPAAPASNEPTYY